MKSAKDLNPKEWKALCAEWPLSGLSQKVFCAERGINYKAFVNWRGRHKTAVTRIAARRTEAASAKPPIALMPVQILDGETVASPKLEQQRANRAISSAITITTRSGHQLHVEDGFNEQTLLRVLRTLKEAA